MLLKTLLMNVKILLHALSMGSVIVKKQTHIRIQHHLTVEWVTFLWAAINYLPLVFSGIASNGSVLTPASCQQLFVEVIIEDSSASFATPGASIARILKLSTSKGMGTEECCG